MSEEQSKVMLQCPEVLHRKNCFLDYLTPEEEQVIREWRWLAANAERARLGSFPFWANRAAKHKARTGSEMGYWLELQGSQMTAGGPKPPDSYVPEPLTNEQIAALLDDYMCIINSHRQPPGVPGINLRPLKPPSGPLPDEGTA
jgi:hypothetical protein